MAAALYAAANERAAYKKQVLGMSSKPAFSANYL
jgi:hypothetical protein